MEGILYGFEVALTPANIFFVVLGALIGTVTGLLPGLGPTATVALLLPLTYSMDPASPSSCWPASSTGACSAGVSPRSC